MNEIIIAMRPSTLTCDTLIRLGRNFDGGYVVNKRSLACDALYGYGVGSEITFDYDWWLLGGGKVYLFDHTVGCPAMPDGMEFHKKGLGPKKDGDLDNFLNVVNPDYYNLLLKIDVECAEYEWVEATSMEAVAARVSTLVLEVHDLPNRQERFLKMLAKIKEHFDIIHVHGNNNAPMKFGVPQDVELTFVRKSEKITGGPVKVCYPLYGIDFPNTPAHPDIKLDYTHLQ